MPKPVPPRFPPARVLNADQNAFIHSLEPQPLHAVPVAELIDRPADESIEDPIDISTELPVDESTERQGDRSPHMTSEEPTAQARARRLGSRANKRQGRVVFERVNSEPVRKLSFYIPADVAKSLQLHCVMHERDMSTFVTDLVRRALSKARA
jgi:hypothetical protein